MSVRGGLGSLLALVALNAVGGGIYGLRGAEGVSTEWLQGTPFDDYTIPSVILLIAVGGSAFVAAVGVFGRRRWGRLSALGSGSILTGWMIVQLWMIGYVSWLQPTFVVIAGLVLVLAWVLPREADKADRE